MNKKKAIIILSIIMTLVCVVNYMYVKNRANPVGINSLGHMVTTVNIAKGFHFQSFLKIPGESVALLTRQYYPPLFYIVSAMALVFFNATVMFMVPTLFLLILIYATYKIGEIIGGRAAGLISAILVSSYPIIVDVSRQFNLYLAQTAMVTLSIYLLLRCKAFRSFKYSLLFGIVAGLGMLSKHMFIVFLVGPLYVATRDALYQSRRDWRILRNLTVALILFVVISSLFYYRYFDPRKIGAQLLEINSTADQIARDQFLKVAWFRYYLLSLKADQLGLPNLVFALGLFIFFIKQYRHYLSYLITWFTMPYLVFSILVMLRGPEYTMSYVPVFAIITGVGLYFLRNKLVRRVLIFVLLAYNIYMYFPCRFNQRIGFFHWQRDNYPSRSDDVGYKSLDYLTSSLGSKKVLIGIITYPTPNDWRGQQIGGLLSLYTQYEVKEVIFDPRVDVDNLTSFDAFIFTPLAKKNGYWLDIDSFLTQIRECNSRLMGHIGHHPLSVLDDEAVKVAHPNNIIIRKSKIGGIISYYTKLRLVKKIVDPLTGEQVLIYRKIWRQQNAQEI